MIFTNDRDRNLKLNLDPKLASFKCCLKQWEHRKLTLLGKVAVIKKFAMPKLIYPLTVLNNPTDSIISDLTKTVYKFLWDNKPEKIKRNIVELDYNQGGIKMLIIKKF